MDELISRRAAIDALEDAEDAFGYLTRDWREVLMELPSAQPEIIYCKDCKYLEMTKLHHCIAFNLDGMEAEFFCGFAKKREVTE